MPKLAVDKQRDKALKEVTQILADISAITAILNAVDRGDPVIVSLPSEKTARGRGKATSVEVESKSASRICAVLSTKETLLCKKAKALSKTYHIEFAPEELALLGEPVPEEEVVDGEETIEPEAESVTDETGTEQITMDEAIKEEVEDIEGIAIDGKASEMDGGGTELDSLDEDGLEELDDEGLF